MAASKKIYIWAKLSYRCLILQANCAPRSCCMSATAPQQHRHCFRNAAALRPATLPRHRSSAAGRPCTGRTRLHSERRRRSRTMQVETTRQTCPAPSDVLTADRFRVAGFAILLGLFSTAALAQSAHVLRRGRQSVGPLDHRQRRCDHLLRCCRSHHGRTSTGGDTMTIYGADGRVIITVTKPQGK